MRQAHFDHGTGSELATRVAFDPRADDGRRMILLGRRCVTIQRRLRGVKMHLSVPVDTYLGVVMAREGQPDGVLYRVSLAHRDPDLSVTLKESRSRSVMIAAWHHWSAYFAPPIILERATAIQRQVGPTRAPEVRATEVRIQGRRLRLGQKTRRGLRPPTARRSVREIVPRA